LLNPISFPVRRKTNTDAGNDEIYYQSMNWICLPLKNYKNTAFTV